MAVAIFAVVTIAATDEKDGDFDMVTARHIEVTNDAGDFVVSLGAIDYGSGGLRSVAVIVAHAIRVQRHTLLHLWQEVYDQTSNQYFIHNSRTGPT